MSAVLRISEIFYILILTLSRIAMHDDIYIYDNSWVVRIQFLFDLRCSWNIKPKPQRARYDDNNMATTMLVETSFP